MDNYLNLFTPYSFFFISRTSKFESSMGRINECLSSFPLSPFPPWHIHLSCMGNGIKPVDWIGLEAWKVLTGWVAPNIPGHKIRNSGGLKAIVVETRFNKMSASNLKLLRLFVHGYLHWILTPWVRPYWSFCGCGFRVWLRTSLIVTWWPACIQCLTRCQAQWKVLYAHCIL